MMRERVTRAALHAFPPATRSARGPEMLGTLLDASATSQARFAREIVDLVQSGLRARATETAQAGAQRLVADGVCLAAVWLLTLFLAADVAKQDPRPTPGRSCGARLVLVSCVPRGCARARADRF